jgi:RHS repeat-associated protein
LGLELERSLPGGVQSRWERDSVGRPIRHEIWSGGSCQAACGYSWEVNDRLRQVVDVLRGPTRYEHDQLGNLAVAIYEDGRVDLRLPDAVGNLFRVRDRKDRSYGPTGQLMEVRREDGGTTKYEYDQEGNLIRKIETDATGQQTAISTYEWNGGGFLTKVVRPDGESVQFKYDALGRRLAKIFRGRTTKWIWDGNVPVHEWVEGGVNAPDSSPLAASSSEIDDVASRRRRAELAARPAQGPPRPDAGTFDKPVTWLFDPESFSPVAKLVDDRRYSILTDHLGTPKAMHDASGREVWAASIDAFGGLRNLRGDRQACPFRWPGQYEDVETGLYYNRFRYYSPEVGTYISQDPLGPVSRSAAYVSDPLKSSDPFGLIEWVDPSTVNYSQAYVTGETQAYEQAMRGNTWDWGRTSAKGNNVAVLTVAEVEGQLVSFDNRRLLAAQNAELKQVAVQRVDLNDIKPGTNITWRESLNKRLNSSPKGSGLPKVQLPPQGTREKPKVVKCG